MLGTDSSADQYYLEHQFDFIDALSRRVGRHQFKFGFDIATIHVISKDRLAETFTFSNLTNYLNTINHVINPASSTSNWYAQLVQAFGNNTADHRTNFYNFYVQDTFQLTPQFTLSYGLRYEFSAYPKLDPNAPVAASRTVRSDPWNWAPRAGFAWRTGSKTVIRGGFGVFYDTLNLRLLSQVIRQNGANVLSYTITPQRRVPPSFRTSWRALPAFSANRTSRGFLLISNKCECSRPTCNWTGTGARLVSDSRYSTLWRPPHPGAAGCEPRPAGRIPCRRSTGILERQSPQPQLQSDSAALPGGEFALLWWVSGGQ
jgi:hypothetical protein